MIPTSIFAPSLMGFCLEPRDDSEAVERLGVPCLLCNHNSALVAIGSSLSRPPITACERILLLLLGLKSPSRLVPEG